jgi:centromere protein C
MIGSPQKHSNPSSSRVASARLAPGIKLAPSRPSFASDYDEKQDSADQMEDDTGLENGGDSFQMINGGDDEEVDEQVEEQQEQPESEAEPELPKNGRGRAKGKGKGKEKERQPEPEPEPEVPQKKARGKARKESLPVGQDIDEPSAKRARRSLEVPQPLPKVATKGKSAKSSKTTTAAPAPKRKAAGKARKLVPIQETESPEIQRGPPLPRNNRGLFILRRETPIEGTGFKQTRSGRNSIKPLAFWKNERVEYSNDIAEDGHGKFLLPKIKEVVRNDEVEQPRRKTTYSRPYKGKKRSPLAEPEEDEIEPWEIEPGRVHGEIRTWDPEDQLGNETVEKEEELALSSRAIITREVANASFGFAKTLSLPFFGSGMLDIPAGGAKKPKNSRKMQMVFFVFYGRVNVTVNDTSFRIGKGGMWQVPRGKIPLSTYS